MIDLHIHTTSSDGSDEPEVILTKAEKAGVSYEKEGHLLPSFS